MVRRIVIKLSGRVFAMDGVKSLKEYARMLAGLEDEFQPIVVAGGGSIARHYINHARSSGADESTLDELGIEISRLNAKLLIYALKNRAYPHPPTTLPEVRLAADSGLVVVAGGLYPGQSTNGTAALIAEKVQAERFINATDVDGVYDSDPNTNKNAKMFRRVDIGTLRNMLAHEESTAGGYDLMDGVALKVIERSGIPTRVMRASPDNLEKAIRGIDTGTEIIHPTG